MCWRSFGDEAFIVHCSSFTSYPLRCMFGLETDRLSIRPWNADDRTTFHQLTCDPAVMQYVHGGLPYSEAELDEWFSRQARQLAEHDVCMGAVIEKASGRLIGIAGTQPLGTTGNMEIGW